MIYHVILWNLTNFRKNKAWCFMRIVCQQTILMKYHALFVISGKATKFEIVVCCKLQVELYGKSSGFKKCSAFTHFLRCFYPCFWVPDLSCSLGLFCLQMTGFLLLKVRYNKYWKIIKKSAQSVITVCLVFLPWMWKGLHKVRACKKQAWNTNGTL